MRLHRLVRRLRHDEGGFTLVELLAAVSIGIIVVLAAFTLLDSASLATQKVDNRVDATQRGRLAMEQVTRSLRARVCLEANDPTNNWADDSTTSMIYGDGNIVVYYSDLGDESFRPDLILLWNFNGTLVEWIFEADGTAPNLTYDLNSIDRSRVLAEKIRTVPGRQVFEYYAYQPSGSPTPHLQLHSDGSALDAADLKRTVRIDVAFQIAPIKGPAGGPRDSTFESTVTSRGARFPNSSQSPPDLGGVECLFA